MCDIFGEVYFSQKIFTNELNMGLSLWTQVEKAGHGVETYWPSVKEKVSVKAVSKEGQADSLLEHEKTSYNCFSCSRCNCKQCFLFLIP